MSESLSFLDKILHTSNIPKMTKIRMVISLYISNIYISSQIYSHKKLYWILFIISIFLFFWIIILNWDITLNWDISGTKENNIIYGLYSVVMMIVIILNLYNYLIEHFIAYNTPLANPDDEEQD